MEGEKGKRASASDNPEGLNLQMNLSFSFTEVSENGTLSHLEIKPRYTKVRKGKNQAI